MYDGGNAVSLIDARFEFDLDSVHAEPLNHAHQKRPIFCSALLAVQFELAGEVVFVHFLKIFQAYLGQTSLIFIYYVGCFGLRFIIELTIILLNSCFTDMSRFLPAFRVILRRSEYTPSIFRIFVL